MASYVALSRSEHQHLFYNTTDRYSQASTLTLAPVLVAEVMQLLPEYMLCFRREKNGYGLHALLGATANAYLKDDGSWQASYVPAVFRAYPFKFAKQRDNQSLLCVDQGALSDEPGQALFDEDGELSESVRAVIEFLRSSEQNINLTRRAVQALASAELLQPWPLRLKTAEYPQGAQISDVYKVDEQRLNQLDNETLGQLRSSGALALAYGQLYALGRIKQLQQRIDQQATQKAEADVAIPDFDALFNEQDDTLQFS